MRDLFILVATGLIVGSFSIAAEPARPKGSIQAYQVGACSYWIWLRSETGQTGYACASMPRTVIVPDGQDVADGLTEAYRKIADLEKRLATVEASCTKP